VDSTRFSSILEQAARDMKELAGGKDQLGSAVCYSHNPELPAGWHHLVDRHVAANQSGSLGNSFW
jgi:hypothetical protein